MGLSAPPPPPPPDPQPIVVTISDATTGAIEATAASTPTPRRGSPIDRSRLLEHEAPAWSVAALPVRQVSLRWATFRTAIGLVLDAFLADLGFGAAQEAVDDELGGSHVLDGEAHRLEGRDGLRIAGLDPAALHGPDLDQVRLRN